VYQLKHGRSVLDRYRSRRSGEEGKEMVGVRVSPEVKQRLQTVADEEGTTTSSLLRSLARELVLAVELSQRDDGITEAIAVESLKDIEAWYSDNDQVAAAAADLRTAIDTTAEY
jgi:predicted DNA-binding protein